MAASESGFYATSSLKIFFQNENIKVISKTVDLKKKYSTILNICNMSVMFYYKTPFIYQDFKNENLYFLNLYSIHAVKILNLSLEVMFSLSK